MTTTLKAKHLSIGEVHRLFGWHRSHNDAFVPLLALEPITETEQNELSQIRQDFDRYLTEAKVLEGMVNLLTTYPLMRLAGFYREPITIVLEQDIDNITIAEEDLTITGRFDILTINKSLYKTVGDPLLWVLLIESKNSAIAASEGLPQLLTYAFDSLKNQESLWGLATNGQNYQFIFLQSHPNPSYQLLPLLSLLERNSSIQLLQVLKAICQL
jgi:hypothetical protein